MTDFWILDGHTPVAVDNVHEWAHWFDKADRHVAKTTVGDKFVSTVFLGLDHSFYEGPPILFETMVFRCAEAGKFTRADASDIDMRRYATWDEAQAGHDEIVAQLRGGQH